MPIEFKEWFLLWLAGSVVVGVMLAGAAVVVVNLSRKGF